MEGLNDSQDEAAEEVNPFETDRTLVLGLPFDTCLWTDLVTTDSHG
jgi:hypothetical protein